MFIADVTEGRIEESLLLHWTSNHEMERHWIHPPRQSSAGIRISCRRPGKSMRQLRVQVCKWTHTDRHKTRNQMKKCKSAPYIEKEKKINMQKINAVCHLGHCHKHIRGKRPTTVSFCRISLQQYLVPHVIDSKWDVSACKGAFVSEEKQSARRAFLRLLN